MPSCPHCRGDHPAKTKACPATGQPMPGVTVPGRVFDGKYKVVRHLADGGMGAVYEAEHLLIGKKVAIKVLHPEFAANDDILERFRREARAATSIGHEGIIEIWDMGRADDGALFIVMELLRGLNLGELLASTKRVDPERAARIMVQVLSALAAAHAHGIVHRDLKPENVFLITRGADGDFVKILDFGISKVLTGEQSMKLTSTGFVLGTPYYMAPEQARGGGLDHRVDIYGAGAILYQMVTGKLPFSAPNFNALLFEIAAGHCPAPRQLVPSLPENFERVIQKAMAIEPSLRYQTCAEFAQALAPWARVAGGSGQRTTAQVSALPPSGSPSQSQPTAFGKSPAHPMGVQPRTLLESQQPALAQMLARAEQGGQAQVAFTATPAAGGRITQALTPAPVGQSTPKASGSRRAGMVAGGALVGIVLGVVLFFMGAGPARPKPRLVEGDRGAVPIPRAPPPAVKVSAADAGSTAPLLAPDAGTAVAVKGPVEPPAPRPVPATSADAGVPVKLAHAAIDAGTAPAPVPDKKLVTITFEVSPPEAKLTWNGEPLDALTKTVEVSPHRIAVTVEAPPAFSGRKLMVVPDQDRTIKVSLQKRGSSGPKKTGPGGQIDL